MRLTPNTPAPITATGSCPHGMPMGMCPSCGGGGGGGGGGAKLRPGEMSFGEGAALWAAFKANKLRQQDQMSYFAQKALAQRAENAAQSGLLAPQGVMVMGVVPRSAAMVRALLQSLTSGFNLKPETLTTDTPSLRARLAAQMERALDITDKLATVLGEKEKLLRERLEAALKRIRRWVVEETIFGQALSVLGDITQRLQTKLSEIPMWLKQTGQLLWQRLNPLKRSL